jgi:hypothetical protein
MRRDWAFIAAITVLTIVAVVRVASTHRIFSATVDEPIHLASGYEWFKGELTLDMTHPPLARVLGALPLRLQGLPYPNPTGMVDRGNQLLYHGDRYVKNLARARIGNLLLLALAIVTVALWARRFFGRAAAIAAAALFSTLPLLLGHAGLLTTDLSVAATLPLALFALDRYLELPSMRRGGFLGVALGLGLLSKFSFLVFFPPSVIVVLLLRRPLRARVATMAVALAIAFLTLWAGYRFDVRRPADVVENGANILEWAAPSPLKPLARVIGRMPIPAPAMPIGMAQVKLHEIYGHTAYLLGRESRNGWWYYFPVVFFYKSPLPWLMLAGWGTVVLFAKWWSERRGPKPALAEEDPSTGRSARDQLQLVAIPAAILVTAMTTSLNIGARHILPILAPLSIVAGYAVVDIWRKNRDAFARLALGGLLAWLVIGVGIEHPDYLAWFNETAQPSPSYFAADSNIDWGQDVLRLARVVEEMKIEHLHTAFMNSTRLEAHGIHATGLVPHQKVTGWVAASENWLRFGEANGDYDWLTMYRPVRQVGKSIRLYYIP